MVKALIVGVLCVTLWADEIDDKIKNIVGQSRFELHKNLINIIFKDRASFYEDNQPSIHKIVTKLKENGILELSKNPNGEIDISFVSKSAPIFVVKSVNDMLKNMGYGYFVTKKSKLSQLGFEWNINIKSELKPDIAIMVNELSKWGCKIVDIQKVDQSSLLYILQIDDPKIPSAKQLFKNTQIESARSLDDYWFEVKEGGVVSFSSKDGSEWYPNIIFFDKELTPLSSIGGKIGTKKIESEIPVGTRFILINDTFSATNIKNGIKASLY